MANSYVRYTGNGGQTQFSLTFSYLDTSHISAFVDGVSTAFTWVSSSIIEFASAPASGAVVEIRRETPAAPIVVFGNGTLLVEEDLDTAQTQSLYLSAEASERTVSDAPGAHVPVASLPSASTAGKGARNFVSDATATTFNSVVAGGGSNAVPVFSDGTDWRIG